MAYGDYAPFITARGYVRLYRPDHPLANKWGHVLEHRMVAWDQGIITDPTQAVHHINHNRADNRPENLQGMTRSEHSRHHGAERRVPPLTPEQRQRKERARYLRRYPSKTCEVCGREYQWRDVDADPRGCSNACRAVLRRRDGWRPAYRHICEVCGREFRSRVGDGRACSPTCRATLRSFGNDPCTEHLP